MGVKQEILDKLSSVTAKAPIIVKDENFEFGSYRLSAVLSKSIPEISLKVKFLGETQTIFNREKMTDEMIEQTEKILSIFDEANKAVNNLYETLKNKGLTNEDGDVKIYSQQTKK